MKLINQLLKNGFKIHKHPEMPRYYVSKKGYRGVVLIDYGNKISVDVACKIANIVHFRSPNISTDGLTVDKVEGLLDYKFKDSAELNSPREVLNIKYLGLKPLYLSNLSKTYN